MFICSVALLSYHTYKTNLSQKAIIKEIITQKATGKSDIVIPKNMKNIGYRVFVRENGIKAKSVTVYGDDPLRFNSQWQNIGLINFGNNNCPVIPEGQNSVTCS